MRSTDSPLVRYGGRIASCIETVRETAIDRRRRAEHRRRAKILSYKFNFHVVMYL